MLDVVAVPLTKFGTTARYFLLGLKDKILTCFQLLSSQYPKPSVRITNKLILKEMLIDSTIYLVYRLCTLTLVTLAAF